MNVQPGLKSKYQMALTNEERSESKWPKENHHTTFVCDDDDGEGEGTT